MTAFFRILLVAMALLNSGALQVVAAMGDDDACCAGETEEKDASCPDCPPGLACAAAQSAVRSRPRRSRSLPRARPVSPSPLLPPSRTSARR